MGFTSPNLIIGTKIATPAKNLEWWLRKPFSGSEIILVANHLILKSLNSNDKSLKTKRLNFSGKPLKVSY